MEKLQFIALLTTSIGSFVLVMVAWLYSNTRIGRLETSMDRNTSDLRAEIKSETAQLRSEMSQIRSEIAQVRSDVRSELSNVRSEIGGLRETVYREMVSLHERVAIVEAKHE